MLKVGHKVRFDPFRDLGGAGCEEIKQTVTGTVAYINEAHGWFSVAYGDGQRTSFRLTDLGDTVSLCGSKVAAGCL